MALSLDGHAGAFKTAVAASTGFVTSGAITAANAGDIIVVISHAETNGRAGGSAPTISSISDTTGLGLSWAQRTSISYNGPQWTNYDTLAVYWAYASSAFAAKTFTANWSVTAATTLDDLAISAFCVTGWTGTAYQTNPWDGSPRTVTSTSTSSPSVTGVNTTSSAGMLIGAEGSDAGTVGAITGFTNIDSETTNGGTNSIRLATSFQVYSSQVVSQTCTWTNTMTGWAAYIDALAIPAAPTSGVIFNSNMDGLGAGGAFFRDPLARIATVFGWRKGLLLPVGA